MFSTDPDARQAFINSLRALAGYLARQPGIPVPAHGTTILLHLDGADHGGRQQVDALAALMGSLVQDDTGEYGHYTTEKSFGTVAYCAVAIPDAATARYRAQDSYWGRVTPDEAGSDA
jgi:hypothetical protein